MKTKAICRAVALLAGFLVLAAINGCGGGGGGGETAAPSPAIATASLPEGARDEPYSAALSATGGTPPYTWSVTPGSLPGGVTLDAATGAVSGTPDADGPFFPDFTVTDSAGAHASKALGLRISKPLTLWVADFSTPSGAVAAFDNACVADGPSAWTRRLAGALTTLDDAVGGPPAGVSYDNARKVLYVARTPGADNGAVLAFESADTVDGNAAPGRVIASYTITPNTFALKSPSDVFIDSGNDRIYIADVTGPGAGIVVVQDNASTTPDWRKTIGVPYAPAAISVDVPRDILYVVPSQGQEIDAYDNVYQPSGVQRTITIDAPGAPGLVDVKVDPATDTAYVADYDGGRVFVIDDVSLKSGTTAPDRTLTGFSNPNSVFPDVANDRLFVSDRDGTGYAVVVVENMSSADGAVTFSRRLSGFDVAAGMAGHYR